MPRKKLPYREGDWIAIPLSKKGYVLCRVARMTGSGVVLGYFFSPLLKQKPTLENTINLSPGRAILIAQFGGLGLVDGVWGVIGQEGDWRREEWPIPIMYRQDVISFEWRAAEYKDDLSGLTREWKIDGVPPPGYSEDAMYGYVAMENKLKKLLT